MTISTVIVLVLGLVLLGIGLFISYKYIFKPSEGAGSIISCESRGGTEVSSCAGATCSLCLKLPSETKKELVFCCIPEK